jgi:hypothetical protein
MTSHVGRAVVAIDADKVQAGPIALLFVVGLGVALVLLLRSLNKQLKRIDFERPEAGTARPERRGRPGRADGEGGDRAGSGGVKGADGREGGGAAPDGDERPDGRPDDGLASGGSSDRPA